MKKKKLFKQCGNHITAVLIEKETPCFYWIEGQQTAKGAYWYRFFNTELQAIDAALDFNSNKISELEKLLNSYKETDSHLRARRKVLDLHSRAAAGNEEVIFHFQPN